MTIATATITVGPTPGAIAGNVYGVGVAAGTLGSGAFPLIATVSYASGPTETVLLRDGIFYAFEEQAASVEVITADASSGTVLVDRARSPRDFVNLASTAAGPQPSLSLQTIPPGVDLLATPTRLAFPTPTWATRATVWVFAVVGTTVSGVGAEALCGRPVPGGAIVGHVGVAWKACNGGGAIGAISAGGCVPLFAFGHGYEVGTGPTTMIMIPSSPPPGTLYVTVRAAGGAASTIGTGLPIWVEWSP